MKILYITPEHVSGTLSILQREHLRRGDECRFVTYWHSRWDYPDDICLNLPFMPDKKWVRGVKRAIMALRGASPDLVRENERPPYWNPGTLERLLFDLRDRANWKQISKAIAEYGLRDFDIVHLDGAADFTRDARFIKQMRANGKHVACFYHGSDLRNRGIIREVDKFVELRLSSEWDLLDFDSRIRYLYLPFETSVFPDRDYHFHHTVRICHASRNIYKGTTYLLQAIERLKTRFDIEFTLLRDVPHEKALSILRESDIFVDQLTNAGGWGYGMSSVEAMAMGLPVITNIPERMAALLGDHPFIQAESGNIEQVLTAALEDEAKCREHSSAGVEWVRSRHDVKAVVDQLYSHYRQLGWMSGN